LVGGASGEASPEGDPGGYAALALPEGSPLSAEDLADVRSFAAEAKLPLDAAQAVLAREASMAAQATELRSQQVTSWEKAVRTDPDLGGTPENLVRTVRAAKAALTKYFPPEVAEELAASGKFSDPRYLRGFRAIGLGLLESTDAMPGAPAPAVPGNDREAWEQSYPGTPYPD
jgi:hypothetical protein